MATGWISVDGQVTPLEKAMIPVMDRGFLFGDGLYEAGRIEDGVPIFLQDHWNRLRRSASKVYMDLPWTDQEMTETLMSVASQFPSSQSLFYRVIVTRGNNPDISIKISHKTIPRLICLAIPLPTHLNQTTSFSLRTSAIVRNSIHAQDPDIKCLGYLNNLLALLDPRSPFQDTDDAVMYNAEGHLTEGTTFSLFAINSQAELLTPSVSTGLLQGVTRQYVIEVAKTIMPVKEGEFSVSEFIECPEVFVTSSTREVMSVSRWDSRDFSSHTPYRDRLQKLYRVKVDQYKKNGLAIYTPSV